jgi:exonuclease III
VTETWLTDDVPDQSAVNITGFNLTRMDRTIGRDGGVAIYVKETIPLKVRSDLSNADFECLWIILRPKWLPRSISRIAVACVYIPPSMDQENLNRFYENFCYSYDILKSESPNTSIIAAGDFNPASNGFNTKIINRQCHLNQVIKKPTRNSTILDHILTDIHKFYQAPHVLHGHHKNK